MGSSNDLVAEYKEKINTCYALTDLGPVHWLLGIRITCDCQAHTISLLQVLYIDSILAQFSLSDAKPCGSPMVSGAVSSKCYELAPIFLFFLLYFLSRDLSCDHHVITYVTTVQVTNCPCDAIVL